MASKPVSGLKQAHEHVKTALPVVTALVTILGTLVTVLESKSHEDAIADVENQVDAQGNSVRTVRVFHTIPTATRLVGTFKKLVTRALGAVVGLCVIGGLVLLALVGGKLVAAVLLTVLILTSVWLASVLFEHEHRERVSRRWK